MIYGTRLMKRKTYLFYKFLVFFSYAIFFNVAMLSGWRHFYFLHIFIIFITTGANHFFIYLKKRFSLKAIYLISFIFILSILKVNYKFHRFKVFILLIY